MRTLAFNAPSTRCLSTNMLAGPPNRCHSNEAHSNPVAVSPPTDCNSNELLFAYPFVGVLLVLFMYLLRTISLDPKFAAKLYAVRPYIFSSIYGYGIHNNGAETNTHIPMNCSLVIWTNTLSIYCVFCLHSTSRTFIFNYGHFNVTSVQSNRNYTNTNHTNTSYTNV